MNNEAKRKLENLLGNESVNLRIGDSAAGEIYRMYKKDGNYFNRVKKAIDKICYNPKQAEKLSGPMKGYCSKHVGSKVIIFRYSDPNNVYIENLDEHDSAYGL